MVINFRACILPAQVKCRFDDSDYRRERRIRQIIKIRFRYVGCKLVAVLAEFKQARLCHFIFGLADRERIVRVQVSDINSRAVYPDRHCAGGCRYDVAVRRYRNVISHLQFARLQANRRDVTYCQSISRIVDCKRSVRRNFKLRVVGYNALVRATKREHSLDAGNIYAAKVAVVVIVLRQSVSAARLSQRAVFVSCTGIGRINVSNVGIGCRNGIINRQYTVRSIQNIFPSTAAQRSSGDTSV